MTALVLGPNGSGKSAFAEKLTASRSSGALIYIATMLPFGEEGQAKVLKHIKQREGFGFLTHERPMSVGDIDLPKDAGVLLEDVSNLLSNNMFGGGAQSEVLSDIKALCLKCGFSVLVSIDGLERDPGFSGETNAYIDALNSLNINLADFADIVIKMRDGVPFCVKGEAYALD